MVAVLAVALAAASVGSAALPACAGVNVAKGIDPQALTWVIVGDLSKIEQPVRSLGLGEVSVIDADGRPVVPAAAK